MPRKAASSTALTKRVHVRPFDPLQQPTRLDRRRWLRHMATNKGPEEMAVEEGVSPATIERSINVVRAWKYRHSAEMVHTRINETVMKHMDAVDVTLAGGLSAKKVIPLGGGKTKTVPDVAMQLKTVETIKGLHELTQPRTPLVQSNTQFNMGVPSSGGNFAPGMSFESRIRMLRERRGLTNEAGGREYDEDGEILDSEDESESFMEELADVSGEKAEDADSTQEPGA